MADIQSMFHQVGVSPGHRDVLRFLWWKDGDMTKEPETYRMTVHLFGGVWSPSCASYALRRVAEELCNDVNSQVTDVIEKDFYVDDCLCSVENVPDAICLVSQLCKSLAAKGFRLTKWLSNKREVIESVPESERAGTVKSLDLQDSPLPVERALGLQWDAENDTLGINITNLEPSFTRRSLLSTMSSVYDPLGFVGPFVLKAKIIFQAECRTGKGWDEKMDEENVDLWLKWLDELTKLKEVQVKRCIVPEDFGNIVDIQLHHFCDASQNAYGSVSYIRIQGDDGSVHVSCVLSKSRLAPIRQVTIPRLELMAAVMAVRVDALLKRELRLEIRRSHFWSDSTIVLQYIKSESKRFHTFVANRLAMIHDGTRSEDWRHMPTKLNPADAVSRGLDADDVQKWLTGPHFLILPEAS